MGMVKFLDSENVYKDFVEIKMVKFEIFGDKLLRDIKVKLSFVELVILLEIFRFNFNLDISKKFFLY